MGPCSKLCQSSNFISTDPSSYIHIPSKLHMFLANSSAISPLSGISILGLVPSVPGDLSVSRLSTGVGTFICQSSAFVPLLPKDNLEAGISPRSSSVEAEAEAPSDVLNMALLSHLSPRAVIIKHLTGPLSHLFPLRAFERPLIFGPTVLFKVTFRVSLDCIILDLTASNGLLDSTSQF